MVSTTCITDSNQIIEVQTVSIVCAVVICVLLITELVALCAAEQYCDVSVMFAGNSASCFSRGSLEWNSILEIYVLQLPVMLEMLHDSGTKVSDKSVATVQHTLLDYYFFCPGTSFPGS